MKKIILVSSLAALALGAGAVIVFGGEEEPLDNEKVFAQEEVIELGSEGPENNGPVEKAQPSGILNEKQRVPIEGMTEEEYAEVQRAFGKMVNLEDVNREIVQMTQQKIESKEIRRVMGGDAPIFPFTPSYPAGIGNFDLLSDYAIMTDNNLEYLKFFVEGLAEDKETTEYYQDFLSDWQDGDYSELIEIHKDLLNDIAVPSEVIEDYLAADDLTLATKEQEEAYINHYFTPEDDYVPVETKVGELF